MRRETTVSSILTSTIISIRASETVNHVQHTLGDARAAPYHLTPHRKKAVTPQQHSTHCSPTPGPLSHKTRARQRSPTTANKKEHPSIHTVNSNGEHPARTKTEYSKEHPIWFNIPQNSGPIKIFTTILYPKVFILSHPPEAVYYLIYPPQSHSFTPTN